MSLGESLIYSRNRSGLRTEPWGTPCLITSLSDVWPLTDTVYTAQETKDKIQTIAKGFIPLAHV